MRFSLSHISRTTSFMDDLPVYTTSYDNRTFSLASVVVLELGCQDSLHLNENLSTGKKNARIAPHTTFQNNRMFLISLAGKATVPGCR